MTIETIKVALDQFDPRTKVGFITFDNTLHFYKFKPRASCPEMLVVSDIDDVFLPALSQELVVNLQANRKAVDGLLEKLMKMFGNSKGVQSALGAAVAVTRPLLVLWLLVFCQFSLFSFEFLFFV